jgi:uncharacterized protein YecA (UPF0149 family)
LVICIPTLKDLEHWEEKMEDDVTDETKLEDYKLWTLQNMLGLALRGIYWTNRRGFSGESFEKSTEEFSGRNTKHHSSFPKEIRYW